VIWLSWRLQRTETLLALAILALLAALLVPTGLNMWDAYQHNGLAACLSPNASQACFNEIGIFRARFGGISSLAGWFTLVPGLIGILFAAPLINDLEHGTYRLAWTQSVTRRRWLAGQLGLAIAGALLAAGLLILLFTWWHNPTAHLDGRLEREIYDNSGTVMLGYTLFAFGLALAVGAVWRRAAASLAVGFVGYFVARVVVDYKVRDHLVAPLRATWHGAQQPPSLFNADVMSMVGTISGHRVLGGGNFFGGTVKLAAPNLRHAVFHATYQPESHYWPLQLTETALFAGIGLVLIAFAAWRVLSSD
jgi:hypothetical protein